MPSGISHDILEAYKGRLKLPNVSILAFEPSYVGTNHNANSYY